MAREVFCRKFKEKLPGLEEPPFPGALGEDIFENISARAWEQWQAHQTTLINERHLNPTDPGARRHLQEQMKKFFRGEEYEKAEGWTPEKD